jgi:hypothetical protein
MEWLTACIALAGVGVVLTTAPRWGLAAYLASLMWYPEYLRINLGAGFSAPRIIMLVLLARCLADSALIRRFRWTTLDSLVAACMVIFSAAMFLSTPLDRWLESQSGFVMDTFLVYLIVRLVVVDRTTLVFLAKVCGLIAVPLAIHGVVETFTGMSLYTGLGQYCSWAPMKGMIYQERHGLNRAMGPQGETILFGLGFVTFLPLTWLLRRERGRWKHLSYVFVLLAIVGVLTTISSGPLLALVVGLFALALERAKGLVKPILALILLGCITIECISSRHFWYTLADLAMDNESGWYRARLLDVAIEQLPEYWLYGYGRANPGWGQLINGMNWTDGVNDYVVHATNYGIFGLAGCVLLQITAIGRMARLVRRSRDPWLVSAAWTLNAALICLMAACWSVSLFSTMVTIYYILIALIAAVDVMSRTRPATQPATLPARRRAAVNQPIPLAAQPGWTG